MPPKPVNERQLDVLQWIGAGCPERSWPDDTFKHSAKALQNRGLARVARRGGIWTAEITDAGRYYLEHGAYPPRATTPMPALKRRRRSARPAPPPASAPTPLSVPLGPDAPTDAQLLLMRLLAADGRLEVATHPTHAAVDELQKAPYLPQGKILKTRGRGWRHRLLYLADDPRAVIAERKITVPERLAKAHPIARAYRDDPDHHEVSSSQLARATRLVHALGTTFEVLGFELRAGRRTPDGQFVVACDGWDVPIRLSERSAPGGAEIPHYNLRRGRRLPAWQARRQKEFISTGQLTMLVGGQYGGREGRQCRFSDTKTRRLEDLLPAVVREVEMRFFERRQDQAEAKLEDEQQEARWQHVLEAAQHRAAEAFRAEVLAKRAARWREWKEQATYVDDVAERLQKLPDEDRTATEAWLTWARRHLNDTDPTLHGHGMPDVPDATREFLEQHIRGWAGHYRAFPV